MPTWLIVAIAVYLTGCLFAVPVALFFACLGGRESDILPALLGALAWPVTIPWELFQRMR